MEDMDLWISDYQNNYVSRRTVNLEQLEYLLKKVPDLELGSVPAFDLTISLKELNSIPDMVFNSLPKYCYIITITELMNEDLSRLGALHHRLPLYLTLNQEDFSISTNETLEKISIIFNDVIFKCTNVYTLDLEKLEFLYKGLKQNVIDHDDPLKIKHNNSKFFEKDLDTFKKEVEIISFIINSLDPDMDDFTKIATIYKTLGKRIEYAHDYRNANYSKIGFFVNPGDESYSNLEGIITGRAICGGFAEILSLTLNSAGIEAKTVSGRTVFGDLHAWNVVKLDGNWYNCDLSADCAYIKTGKKLAKFLKSDDTFKRKGYLEKSLEYDNYRGENVVKCEIDYDLNAINERFDYFTVCTMVANSNGFDVNIINDNGFKIIISKDKLSISFDILDEGMLYDFFYYVCGDNSYNYENGRIVVNDNIICFNYGEVADYLNQYGYSLTDYVESNAIQL